MTAPQTVADVLDAAANIIEPEGAWTRGTYAADRCNDSVDTLSSDAKCFCAMGAVYRAVEASSIYKTGPIVLVGDVRRYLYNFLGCSAASFNDHPDRKQSEVVAALRAAATSARQGETA